MKKFIALIILSAFVLAACFQEKEDFYFQGLFVEFNEVSLSPAPGTFAITISDGAGVLRAQVNLVGVQQETDQTIRFSVAPQSTARLEKHYSLDGNTFVIPAFSSFGYVEFTILDAGIPDGESVDLTLVLEGNDRILPSENFRRQTYVIQGKQ